MKTNIIEATFLGLAVGDALGVPVEFIEREHLKKFPVMGMREFGSHNQPIGTWSDDSSLTFCLAESLCKKYDTNDIAKNFAKWYSEILWTPHGKVFDIGIATNQAINSFIKGTPATLCGGKGEFDNGNGSLMRISPIAFYIKDLPIEKRFDIVKEVSSITHGHIRSVISCFIYVEYMLDLLVIDDKFDAYAKTQKRVNDFLTNTPICSQNELNKFHRILENPINDYIIEPVYTLSEKEISSSGYVLNTLEASLWCFLNTNNYKDTVLKAVNLGNDTDTTACIVGALAGLHYGKENIPNDWIEKLVKKDDIINLSIKLSKKLKYPLFKITALLS